MAYRLMQYWIRIIWIEWTHATRTVIHVRCCICAVVQCSILVEERHIGLLGTRTFVHLSSFLIRMDPFVADLAIRLEMNNPVFNIKLVLLIAGKSRLNTGKLIKDHHHVWVVSTMEYVDWLEVGRKGLYIHRCGEICTLISPSACKSINWIDTGSTAKDYICETKLFEIGQSFMQITEIYR